MPKPLTQRQQEVLDFIAGYQESNDCSPTLEEIAEQFGISKPTAYEHLRALQDKERIDRDRYRQRSIRLTDHAAPVASAPLTPPGMPRVPIVGRVAAGFPIEAIEDREAQSVMDLIPSEGCFALQVRGDSMIEDQIRDGDFVILEGRKDARNGETVVALIDKQEATLKRWRRVGREVSLEPRNSSMAPMVYDASRVEIAGVLVGLVRRY